MARATHQERPIIRWSDLTRELKEVRDPSHGASIICRAIKNLTSINNSSKEPRKEFNSAASWIGALKTKIIGLLKVDKP